MNSVTAVSAKGPSVRLRDPPIGATVLTLAGGDVVLALIPLVVGLLSAFVAYGRWRLAPHRGSSHRSGLQPAS